MKKVVGEPGLALQQHFPYKSSKFSENSNCWIMPGASNLAILIFSDALFPLLAFFKL